MPPLHVTASAIDQKDQLLGGASGLLGKQVQNETICSDGVGHYRQYEHGSIYWTPDTGACELHGAIRDKWASLGWEQSVLGYPTTDEMTTPHGIGRYNHFEHGSIYWTPDTGACELLGAIHDKWASLGWKASVLGYPTTDEMTTADGVGRYNRFEHGSIYWTPATGACELHGAIHDKWISLGLEQSCLGYPTTDELPSDDDIGRYNNFQNGSIYWSDQDGTHVLKATMPPPPPPLLGPGHWKVNLDNYLERVVIRYLDPQTGFSPELITKGAGSPDPPDGVMVLGYSNYCEKKSGRFTDNLRLERCSYYGVLRWHPFKRSTVVPFLFPEILRASLTMFNRKSRQVVNGTISDGGSMAYQCSILLADWDGTTAAPCVGYTVLPPYPGVSNCSYDSSKPRAQLNEVDRFLQIDVTDLLLRVLPHASSDPYCALVFSGVDDNATPPNDNEQWSEYTDFNMSIEYIGLRPARGPEIGQTITASQKHGQNADIVKSFKSDAVQLRVVDALLGQRRTLDTPAAQESDESSKTPKGSRSRAKTSTALSDFKVRASSFSRRSGLPGAYAMITELLGSGFFKQPKTIGDIVAHSGTRRGHHYKANECSPALLRLVRDGKLARKKNKDGRYAYTQA